MIPYIRKFFNFDPNPQSLLTKESMRTEDSSKKTECQSIMDAADENSKAVIDQLKQEMSSANMEVATSSKNEKRAGVFFSKAQVKLLQEMIASTPVPGDAKKMNRKGTRLSATTQQFFKNADESGPGNIEQKPRKATWLQQSHDLGGHGGTKTCTITLDGRERHLFLKPFDEIEALNYAVVQKVCKDTASDLLTFVPEVHGKIEIEGKEYLVMENIRMDSSGAEVRQKADIKLSAFPARFKTFFQKLFSMQNPIASKKEIRATRQTKKNYLNFLQMKWGAAL